MYKLDLEKAVGTEIKLPTSVGAQKKEGNSRGGKIYFCFIDYVKAFDNVDYNELWEILKEMGIQIPLPTSLGTCIQVKKQQLEPDTEQCTGSKLGKEYVKAVYDHPAYLTYMQSTSWEMPGQMKHKLLSRFPREVSTTKQADDTTLIAESEEELKSLLMKVKEKSEKLA